MSGQNINNEKPKRQQNDEWVRESERPQKREAPPQKKETPDKRLDSPGSPSKPQGSRPPDFP
jgi:hypothetical protein